MSKAHSRARLDKGSHNHGYYNRNSTGEEKRPSVFDRLGTRRENSSNSSHYAAEGNPASGSYKSKTSSSDPYKSSHIHTQRPCHSSTKQESHGRSRSRSVSPRLKKKAVQSSVGSKTKTPVRSLTSAREKEKSASRKSSPKRNSGSKTRSTVGKSSSKTRSSNTVSGKKKNASKSKGKIRSSSLSSEGSSSRGSSTSSSTHTRTTSSTTESSSSTAASTTSDSSVPSIKLKPAKKDKPKKKMKKKSRVSSSVDKLRHSETPVKQQSVSSSVSSRDSRKDTGHHYKDASRSKSSGGSWVKSPTRTSNSYERRSFSKEISRVPGRDKEPPPSGRTFDHVSRNKERIEEETRKRRLSDDAYGGSSEGNYAGHKRSRTVPSPPPKYKSSVGRRTPSPSPRRVPPDSSSWGHKTFSRRERTPSRRSASKERERLRIIRSPHRRPSFEDHHRRPESSSRSDRHLAPSYNKGKDLRDRDRPYISHGSSGNNFDKPGYPSRDTSRPRDRFAPVRAAPALDRGRIAPKHVDLDRDRGIVSDRPKEYEPLRGSGRPPPLLGAGPPKTGLPNKPSHPRGSIDDAVVRPGHSSVAKRHMRMIVKTKEDLQERYEEETIKQSRVDMWVDQTLQGSGRIVVDTFESEKLPSKGPGDETRTPTPDEIKDKCSSIGSLSGINLIESTTKPDAENSEKNLQLSDFSDDADDILTQEVKQPSPARTDSPSNKVVVTPAEDSSVGVATDVVGVRTGENASAELDKESAPTVVSAASSIPPRNSFDRRYTQSLPSQSQTDDDILERMDFEEISDDEFREVENKVSIVDVFGVNWASLLSRSDRSELPSSQTAGSDGALPRSVRQRWTPIHVFQQVGISRKLCGETLFHKVVDKIKENLKLSAEDPKHVNEIEEELEKPMCRRRRLERSSLLENYGLGPHSRALSAKRDMAVRRYLLNLPPKNLACLDFGNQASGPINAPQEQDFATDLLKLSVTNYKNS